MPSVDSRPQAFHGQPPQQRRPEDHVNSFHPVSSGDFLLQDGFAFSAEPGLIDYTSMSTLAPSSTTGQETVFTPNTNTASSFDSSLHFSSYPPPSLPVHNPNFYSLSPGQHSRNGQSISPSHSVDNFSPEAGYASDLNYQDHSSFNTTPNYNGNFLEGPFSSLTFGDNATANNFDPYALPMTAEGLQTFNAQAQVQAQAQAQAQAQGTFAGSIPLTSQLMSPCTTNNSSPMIPDEVQRSMSAAGAQFQGNESQPSPPVPFPQTAHSTPRKQQHSPALTNSPNGAPASHTQSRARHLASPIVYVQHITGNESPSHSDISRPVSKRSHGSHHSKNHLSPYPNEDSSDDEEMQPETVKLQPVVAPSAQRGDDGSWLPGANSGQTGLSPDDRQAMNQAWTPSIEEIAEQRLKEEKKLEVHAWLTKSEVGSEAGDASSSSNLLKPGASRPRAKSTNDAHRYGLGVNTTFLRPDDSGIPGPGVYVDEHSEYDDYDDDEDEDFGPESPPAEVDIAGGNADDSDYPPAIEAGPTTTVAVRPWGDGVGEISAATARYQPPTSNAAMMRFYKRAKDVESASLAATVGSRTSRRLSESDMGSVRAVPGVIKAIEPDLKKSKDRQRRPSFLENLLPKRTPSNPLKRQLSIPPPQQIETASDKAKEAMPEKPKRIGSWGRPKSPRLDTSVANHGVVGPPSTTNLSATSGPWLKNAIRRSRSRSDLGRSPGLAELFTKHGGPPMPTIATSPLADTGPPKLSPQPSPGADDDEDDVGEAVTMDLKVRSDPIIPSYEGFKTHARQLNPRLVDYMVDRITQEQMRRYKRLLEFKVKHMSAVKDHNCASASFCTELGGESKQLPPRAGNKDSDAPFIGFQITAPGSSDDDGEPPPEGTVISAQFPSGVPLPPVKRLPAEFECPLCFKVKKFYKPSDWTKHVHEDVQPFTCTFPNCGEPKSFKRKADWVRHENERHRQLENWTCQIADCNHTCYRKDNFVQHLVREHKIAEPRARTGRGAATKDAGGDGSSWQQGFKDNGDDIWSLVEKCRRDTTKQPKDEPCRFCGNICNSWKKLTVHLAKHMEQISMPILPLVEQKQMSADTVISPVVEMPESRKLSGTPNRSPIDNPSRYNPNTNMPAAMDSSFAQFAPPEGSAAVASNVMHTYPPPQMMYKTQQPVQKPNYANYGVNGQGYPAGTYPGVHDPSKTRGIYVNGLQIPSQPYMNGNIQSGPNRFPMTPISAVGQGQQPFLTSSPVDTTPFTTDTLGATYYTQEPQNLASSGGMPDMSFDPYQAQQFQDMSYMTTQSHSYPYQGQ